MIWDEEAEKAVIGMGLLRPPMLDRVELQPEDFHALPHRAVFAVMRRLRHSKLPGGPLAVNDALGDKANAVGGLPALTGMYNATASADNVEYYAAIIRRKALTRQIRARLGDVLAGTAEGVELLSAAHEAISRVNKRLPDESSTMAELARATYSELQDRLDGKEREVCSTGLVELDHVLGGGLEPGTLTVIGGWTSEGKSALLRCIANAVAKNGHGVDYYGLEDSHRSLGMRALSDNARVELQRVRQFHQHDRPTMPEIDRLISSVDTLALDNWRITSRAGLTTSDIARRVRRHRDELSTKIVCVDYLQLLKDRGDSLRERVGNACQGLKELAVNENLAVITGSQFRRKGKDDKRPTKEHLRETGNIEQDADVVALIYHDEPWHGVLVEKQRNGVLGEVELAWDKRHTAWRDLPLGGFRR